MFKEFLQENKEYFNFWGFLIAFSAVVLSINNSSSTLNLIKIISSLILLASACAIAYKLLSFFNAIDKKIRKDKKFFVDIDIASTFLTFFIFFFVLFFKFLKESYASELSAVYLVISFCIIPMVLPLFLYIVNSIKEKSDNKFGVFIKNIIFPCIFISSIFALFSSGYNNFSVKFIDKIILILKQTDIKQFKALLAIFLILLIFSIISFYYSKNKDKK